MNRTSFLRRKFDYLFSFELVPSATAVAAGSGAVAEPVYNARGEAQALGEAALRGSVEFSHPVLRFPSSSETGDLSGRMIIRTLFGHLIEGTYAGVIRVREPWAA